MLVATKAWSPGPLPLGGHAYTFVTVPGAKFGDAVTVTANKALNTQVLSGNVHNTHGDILVLLFNVGNYMDLIEIELTVKVDPV
jgi:hypothetical protein